MIILHELPRDLIQELDSEQILTLTKPDQKQDFPDYLSNLEDLQASSFFCLFACVILCPGFSVTGPRHST